MVVAGVEVFWFDPFTVTRPQFAVVCWLTLYRAIACLIVVLIASVLVARVFHRSVAPCLAVHSLELRGVAAACTNSVTVLMVLRFMVNSASGVLCFSPPM